MVVRGLSHLEDPRRKDYSSRRCIQSGEGKLQLNTLEKVKNEENLEVWNSSKCSERNR
jgi:hypothetical protein